MPTVSKHKRRPRGYRAADPAYNKAIKRRGKPLASILEDVVILRSKGFSIVAKRNGKTVEIAN